jgi:rRNA small subunit pseudouridine methyltransferase Nep1
VKNHMLYILLAETASEIIPGKYRGHSSVLNNAKKYGNPGRILDSALHHSFMKNLKDSSKRGRPDILQQFLITCLTSILCKNDQLRIYFHTYSNEIFEVNPMMRPPKDYIRFKGLIYKLLTEKKITAGHRKSRENNANSKEKLENPILINNIRLPIQGFVKQINPDKIFRFTSKGKIINRTELFSIMHSNSEQNILCIVGGFQSGSFSQSITDIEAEDISIYPEGLETNTVINQIIINFENALGI